MDQLRDRRHLTLQAQEVDPPLLERGGAGGEQGLGRPSHLPLDLADEGLDARGRGAGFLVLERDDRTLVLPVAEPELDTGARHQHRGDQRHDDDDILPEQPAARTRRVRLR